MIINDYVKQTLSLHCFGFVTSFNSNKRSELTRVFGYTLDDGTEILSVLIYKGGASKLLACLDNTKKMSVVLNDPFSFQTIQLKGEYISHADSTPEEEALIKGTFRDRMNEVLTAFGFPVSSDVLNKTPSVTIKIQCKEIYDQTPRINTGVKIS